MRGRDAAVPNTEGTCTRSVLLPLPSTLAGRRELSIPVGDRVGSLMALAMGTWGSGPSGGGLGGGRSYFPRVADLTVRGAMDPAERVAPGETGEEMPV